MYHIVDILVSKRAGDANVIPYNYNNVNNTILNTNMPQQIAAQYIPQLNDEEIESHNYILHN